MTTLLEGHTATLPLSNSHALRIKVMDSGDGVYYQYIGGTDSEILEAEITYEENEDEGGELLAAFKDGDTTYFLSEFLRDDYGRR